MNLKHTTILAVEDHARDEARIFCALDQNKMGGKVFVTLDGLITLDFLPGRKMQSLLEP